MNRGTIIRLVLAIAVTINDGAVIAGVADMGDPVLNKIYKWASFIATVIVVGINHYFNNDYTIEGVQGTTLTRQQKQLKKIINDAEFKTMGPGTDEDEEMEAQLYGKAEG